MNNLLNLPLSRSRNKRASPRSPPQCQTSWGCGQACPQVVGPPAARPPPDISPSSRWLSSRRSGCFVSSRRGAGSRRRAAAPLPRALRRFRRCGPGAAGPGRWRTRRDRGRANRAADLAVGRGCGAGASAVPLSSIEAIFVTLMTSTSSALPQAVHYPTRCSSPAPPGPPTSTPTASASPGPCASSAQLRPARPILPLGTGQTRYPGSVPRSAAGACPPAGTAPAPARSNAAVATATASTSPVDQPTPATADWPLSGSTHSSPEQHDQLKLHGIA